jgi:hypothetical protein
VDIPSCYQEYGKYDDELYSMHIKHENAQGGREDAWKVPMFRNHKEAWLGPWQGRNVPWF